MTLNDENLSFEYPENGSVVVKGAADDVMELIESLELRQIRMMESGGHAKLVIVPEEARRLGLTEPELGIRNPIDQIQEIMDGETEEPPVIMAARTWRDLQTYVADLEKKAGAADAASSRASGKDSRIEELKGEIQELLSENERLEYKLSKVTDSLQAWKQDSSARTNVTGHNTVHEQKRELQEKLRERDDLLDRCTQMLARLKSELGSWKLRAITLAHDADQDTYDAVSEAAGTEVEGFKELNRDIEEVKAPAYKTDVPSFECVLEEMIQDKVCLYLHSTEATDEDLEKFEQFMDNTDDDLLETVYGGREFVEKCLDAGRIPNKTEEWKENMSTERRALNGLASRVKDLEQSGEFKAAGRALHHIEHLLQEHPLLAKYELPAPDEVGAKPHLVLEDILDEAYEDIMTKRTIGEVTAIDVTNELARIFGDEVKSWTTDECVKRLLQVREGFQLKPDTAQELMEFCLNLFGDESRGASYSSMVKMLIDHIHTKHELPKELMGEMRDFLWIDHKDHDLDMKIESWSDVECVRQLLDDFREAHDILAQKISVDTKEANKRSIFENLNTLHEDLFGVTTHTVDSVPDDLMDRIRNLLSIEHGGIAKSEWDDVACINQLHDDFVTLDGRITTLIPHTMETFYGNSIFENFELVRKTVKELIDDKSEVNLQLARLGWHQFGLKWSTKNRSAKEFVDALLEKGESMAAGHDKSGIEKMVEAQIPPGKLSLDATLYDKVTAVVQENQYLRAHQSKFGLANADHGDYVGILAGMRAHFDDDEVFDEFLGDICTSWGVVIDEWHWKNFEKAGECLMKSARDELRAVKLRDILGGILGDLQDELEVAAVVTNELEDTETIEQAIKDQGKQMLEEIRRLKDVSHEGRIKQDFDTFFSIDEIDEEVTPENIHDYVDRIRRQSQLNEAKADNKSQAWEDIRQYFEEHFVDAYGARAYPQNVIDILEMQRNKISDLSRDISQENTKARKWEETEAFFHKNFEDEFGGILSPHMIRSIVNDLMSEQTILLVKRINDAWEGDGSVRRLDDITNLLESAWEKHEKFQQLQQKTADNYQNLQQMTRWYKEVRAALFEKIEDLTEKIESNPNADADNMSPLEHSLMVKAVRELDKFDVDEGDA